jgi:hypothetical protein
VEPIDVSAFPTAQNIDQRNARACSTARRRRFTNARSRGGVLIDGSRCESTWVEARRELEAALAALDPQEREKPSELLVDLLEVCWWRLDVPMLPTRANAVVALAEDLGRVDLKLAATRM